jgi:hypothetical protein
MLTHMEEFVLHNNIETKTTLSKRTGLSLKQIETWIYNSRKTKWYRDRKEYFEKKT